MSVKISLQQEASTEIPASLLNSFFKNLTRLESIMAIFQSISIA